MIEKFIDLKQGNSIVKEYINNFNGLAKFGLLIDTTTKKATKFTKGLSSPLRKLPLSQISMGVIFESLV